MSKFIHKIVGELRNNKSIKDMPLVKMLVESTGKSVALNESNDLIYSNLKNGLIAINEMLNNATLSELIVEFNNHEVTPESQVAKIAKEVNLLKEITSIKKSNAYTNPLIKTQVDLFESAILGGTPDFSICGKFVDVFETYKYDATINNSLSAVKSYITNNKSKLAVLNTIFQMDSINSTAYAAASADLKNAIITESYSADSLKLKYNNSVPLISALISELRIIESAETGNFTIGEGTSETFVNNLIAPAIKTNEGILMYTDNRFISIRESKGLVGNEKNVYIDTNYKIAEVNPNSVKEAYGNFYDLCEAYATLGFAKTEDGLGVESNSIKKFKVGFKVNESNHLDMYLNGEKVETPSIVNLSEALALESNLVKTKLTRIVENTSSIFNFEFIKEVTNHRTLNEAVIINLNESYFICAKPNSAERHWKEVDEYGLYEFFKANFNYDISPIFKTKIEESENRIKQIEEKKSSILVDIKKLEGSLLKLDEACANPFLMEDEKEQFTSIRESINTTIEGLKKGYLELDLSKKKQN